jgi:ATP phosphoribosyltransferase regulatory subunit
VFRSYGYEDIETPTFEFFEVFSREMVTSPSNELYKFYDRDGNTLVLRADFTPSIARAASVYFTKNAMPVRLCYQGNTFINATDYQGRLKESTQMGVELLGDFSVDADAEVIALSIELLKKCGIKEFQISIGQVDFFKALIKEAQMTTEVVQELRQLISNKNHFGVEELVLKQHLEGALEQAFLQLPQLFGGVEVLEHAMNLACNTQARQAVARLEEIYEVLCYYGVEDYISFDFGMLSKYNYYTGIIFHGFTYGSGEPLVKGGRYDDLMQHFGASAPAVGFGLYMDQVMNALERQSITVPESEKKTMILYARSYKEELRKAAIVLCEEHRRHDMKVVVMSLAEGKSFEDYQRHGIEHQFAGIVYLKDPDIVELWNLDTGEIEETTLSRLYRDGAPV